MAKLHPKMIAHAQNVKAAHAHLAKTVPNFSKQPKAVRMKAVQDHIRVAGSMLRSRQGGQ